MLPVLLSIGPVKIYSMGVLLVLGIFWGLYYWWKLGRDEHWDEIALFDSFFLGLIAFLVFGRLGYVLMHWEDLGTIYRILAFLVYPGISYLTGIVAFIVSTVFFGRSRAWESAKVLDIVAVVLPLILAFGFVGSLLNGSNPGREVSFGLIYPGVSGKHFPVDLWGIIWSIVTFVIAVRVRKNFRFYAWYKGSSSSVKDGLAASITLGMAGIFALFVGFMDDSRKIWLIPTISIVGLLIIIGSALIIWRRKES